MDFSCESPARAAFVAAAERWPGFGLTLAEFERHLRVRAAADGCELAELAGSPHVSDLFLACACLTGDKQAVGVLEREYVASLPVAAGTPGGEDLQQLLLERLILGKGGEPGKLAEYSGRSSLRAWLRVVAKRLQLNLLRRKSERPAEDPELTTAAALVAPGQNPELEYMRLRYAREYQSAFRAAFATLDAKQRFVLRLYAIEGATGSEIAATMNVSRVTVVRWIAQVRRQLFDETLERMREEFHLSSTEFESVARMVQSQLDLSLSQLLESAS